MGTKSASRATGEGGLVRKFRPKGRFVMQLIICGAFVLLGI